MAHCANAHSSPKAPRLRFWPPFLILAVGWEAQSEAASPCFSTNGKAVANTPVIFLALQLSGTLWVGRVSLLAWNALGECKGGVGRDGEGRKVEREEKKGRSGVGQSGGGAYM